MQIDATLARPRALGRARALFLHAARVIAGTALLSACVSSARNVSQAFDVWYYHVPFAARIFGIVPASEFGYSQVNQARYDGFPLLGEALQGFFYWSSGRPESVNLVASISVVLFILFLRQVYRIPWHLTALGLLAVPLVQTHITSAYVDLPANLALTASALLALRAWAKPHLRTRAYPIWGIGLLAVAANMRFQLVPAVTLVLGGWGILCLRARKTVFVVLALLVYITPVKNLILHGNPVFPVEFHLFGKALPFVEPQYASKPEAFQHVPGPLLWLRSVFELDAKPLGDGARWSVDQWAPASDPACRMGGFFGLYVAGLLWTLGALGLSLWRARGFASIRRPLILFGCATVIAILAPQSLELRYYMFWMLLLVSLVLIAARKTPAAATALVLTAFAVVTFATTGKWLTPAGSTFAQFLENRVPESTVPQLVEGNALCVDEPPFNFLYAARFHRAHAPYRVIEATDGDRDSCGKGVQTR